MRFLLAGGAGEIGRHVSRYIAERGHEVVVLDKAPWAEAGGLGPPVVIRGDLQDKKLVEAAVAGADVVVNLAWSFADDAATIFREDLGGHVNLLEAAAAAGVRRFIYASTAAVYGAPLGEPVTEDHPCLPLKARKPLYALGKFSAEQLCHIYHNGKGLPATVIRFWWAFGDTIGGRHLREMVAAAENNEPLKVVAGAGGTFVAMDDLAAFILAAAGAPAAAGGVYNLGSLFLTWTEIAAMIIDMVDSRSYLVESSGGAWRGPAFLNERWRLSWEKAVRETGYQPQRENGALREAFARALAGCAGQAPLGVAR